MASRATAQSYAAVPDGERTGPPAKRKGKKKVKGLSTEATAADWRAAFESLVAQLDPATRERLWDKAGALREDARGLPRKHAFAQMATLASGRSVRR